MVQNEVFWPHGLNKGRIQKMLGIEHVEHCIRFKNILNILVQLNENQLIIEYVFDEPIKSSDETRMKFNCVMYFFELPTLDCLNVN